MDVENISGVNSGYSTSEISMPKPQPQPQQAVATVEASGDVEKLNMQDDRVSKTKESEKREGEDEKKKHVASEASIDDAVKSANRKMEKTRCEYSYHEKTHRVSIKVIDSDTDKVIREIPPKESLDMLQKMWEMAGILVDERR